MTSQQNEVLYQNEVQHSVSNFRNLKTMKAVLFFISLVVCTNLLAQNIHRTACKGNLARLDSLLNHNPIAITDNRGRSLLHWAIACKQKAIVDLLVKKGIAINTLDDQQRTPLHVAVQFDNLEYSEYLINLQKENDWQSDFGASLLELAVLNRNTQMIEQLLDSGIDVNTKNQRGSTALEIAQRTEASGITELLVLKGADTTLVRTFTMRGPYMGLKAPISKPEVFAPNFISTEGQEFGSVFNKKGTAFYFGVDVGKRNEIRYTEMIDGKWSKPTTLLSHERYSYNDPFLSNDENRLYFISKRALDGMDAIKDVDIWYIEKKVEGWSEPINAGTTINTIGDEYYMSFTYDGTMYFASNGHTRKDSTRTDHDIYYSKFIDNTFQAPIILGEAINTPSYEADVFVAPDESYLIFCSVRDEGYGRGDLYVSFKNFEGNWTAAVNMGKEINSKAYEYCPFVTKDGKYLFYTSNQDIYWVSTTILAELKQKTKMGSLTKGN